jgi:hypothetical protein
MKVSYRTSSQKLNYLSQVLSRYFYTSVGVVLLLKVDTSNLFPRFIELALQNALLFERHREL